MVRSPRPLASVLPGSTQLGSKSPGARLNIISVTRPASTKIDSRAAAVRESNTRTMSSRSACHGGPRGLRYGCLTIPQTPTTPIHPSKDRPGRCVTLLTCCIREAHSMPPAKGHGAGTRAAPNSPVSLAPPLFNITRPRRPGVMAYLCDYHSPPRFG